MSLPASILLNNKTQALTHAELTETSFLTNSMESKPSWEANSRSAGQEMLRHLTLWRRNYYFFLILAHPVYKMWIIRGPNKLELWNKLHFEEKETESIEHV